MLRGVARTMGEEMKAMQTERSRHAGNSWLHTQHMHPPPCVDSSLKDAARTGVLCVGVFGGELDAGVGGSVLGVAL